MGEWTDLFRRYEFNWEVLEVLIGGNSPIDTESPLDLRTPNEVYSFLDCYGFNLDNPIEKAALFGIFQESLNFIRKYFLKPDNPEGLKIEIPRKYTEMTEVSQLLVQASKPSLSASDLWACAILKVMHTIAHLDKDLRSNYFKDIQIQILDRFYKFIHTDENGQLYLGQNNRDADRVNLVAFESKPKKTRDSVILKLLHKSENVAEDIFDRVGIRFVTKTRFEALQVVKFLKDKFVIIPANIKPSRSRNTLVDIGAFASELQSTVSFARENKLSIQDIDKRLIAFCEEHAPPVPDGANPHTNKAYRTIQFTCRQLIKLQNPLFADLKALKTAVKDESPSKEIGKIIERLDLQSLQKEIRFFYPFEVQVYDEKSHLENIAGQSSHSNYKKSQIQTAMKRVLGGLLKNL